MSEWIRIKDKLPCFGEYVLVHYPPVMNDLSVGINCYSEKNGWELKTTEAYAQGITHWMHLPSPPEIQL
jgi:hypothetical protein